MQLEWEVWLDVNISPIIAKWMIEATGYKVKSSYVLSTQSLDDLSLYQLAKESGNVILFSKDSDFPDIVNRLGSPPKLINLKIGNCDNRKLWQLIEPKIKEAIDLLVYSDITIVDLESKTIR